jgi:ATP-binding cassette subfamily B protein
MKMSKPKDARKTFARVLGYLMRQKVRLFLVVFFVLLSSLSGVAGTFFIKPIINEGILPLVGTHPQGADFLPLVKLILIAAAGVRLGRAFRLPLQPPDDYRCHLHT